MKRNATGDLFRWISSLYILPHRCRGFILRRSGVFLGEQCLLMSGVRITKKGPVSIGSNVFINHEVYFDGEASITIGDNCQIGDHVKFVTSTHQLGDAARRAGPALGLPISVGSGAWIGSGSTILPGVTIGAGCVVAAGAVVNRNCVENALYAGVPARLIRMFSDQ